MGSRCTPRPARSTSSSRTRTTRSRVSRERSTSCRPPLRAKGNEEALWRGLKMNDLQAVSTDHCPFCMKEQKELGKGDFSKIPNGAPGIETRMSLLWDGGVVKGRISPNRFVELDVHVAREDLRPVPEERHDRAGLGRGPRRLRSEPQGHALREDAPPARGLHTVRGPRRPGRGGRRDRAGRDHREGREVPGKSRQRGFSAKNDPLVNAGVRATGGGLQSFLEGENRGPAAPTAESRLERAEHNHPSKKCGLAACS